MGVNGMLSMVIRSHATNVIKPCRTEPFGTVVVTVPARPGTVLSFFHTAILSMLYHTVPYSVRFYASCERSISLISRLFGWEEWPIIIVHISCECDV